MKQKINNFIISILLFACFVLYAIIELRPVSKVNDSKAEVKRLEQENDSLKRINNDLDKKLEKLQIKAERLEEIVIATNDSIQQLKKKQHEKINAIDGYSNDELFNFFAGYKTQSRADR